MFLGLVLQKTKEENDEGVVKTDIEKIGYASGTCLVYLKRMFWTKLDC